MWIVVGLGNPGAKYENTRHNIGFWALEALSEAWATHFSSSKFRAEQAKARLGSEDVLLLKPTTFMNLSGEAVGPAVRFFKTPASRLLVIHDELDLPLGTARLKRGGGHGGHNGLRSIIGHLGGKKTSLGFALGYRGPLHGGMWRITCFPTFAPDEQALAEDMAQKAVLGTRSVISEGLAKTMNRFNQQVSADQKQP